MIVNVKASREAGALVLRQPTPIIQPSPWEALSLEARAYLSTVLRQPMRSTMRQDGR